jgi:hypothetical protein
VRHRAEIRCAREEIVEGMSHLSAGRKREN